MLICLLSVNGEVLILEITGNLLEKLGGTLIAPARAHRYGLAACRYSGVSDTPLQDSESVPAQLAPEGINVKKAHQTFKTVPSGCSSDIVAGTLGTMNLSADLRSHSGRKIARNRDESKDSPGRDLT